MGWLLRHRQIIHCASASDKCTPLNFVSPTILTGFFSAASNLGTACVLQQHFGRKFGSINSLALIGISMGSTVLPLITAELLREYGLSGALLILGAILLNELPIGAVLVPPKTDLNYESVAKDDPPPHVAKLNSGKSSSLISLGAHESELSNLNGNAPLENGHHSPEMKDGATDCKYSEKSSFSVTVCFGGLFRMLKDTFDFRIFRMEKHFTLFMIPMLIMSSIANYSWVLFVTSYAISVGVDPFQAAYLASVGAAGGMTSCALQAVVFHKRPHWSPHLLCVFSLCAGIMLCVQTMNSSLPFLLICSFIIGASLYGTLTVVDAVVAVIVAPRNFQGVIAFTFALEGVGTLIAGPISGEATLHSYIYSVMVIRQLLLRWLSPTTKSL